MAVIQKELKWPSLDMVHTMHQESLHTPQVKLFQAPPPPPTPPSHAHHEPAGGQDSECAGDAAADLEGSSTQGHVRQAKPAANKATTPLNEFSTAAAYHVVWCTFIGSKCA
jgi:hypothetical protein